MSLTLSEQLELANGLKPDAVDKPLIDLTHASGVNAARDFNPNHKVFPTVDNTDPLNPIPINQDANQYLNKMLNATGKMISSDSAGLNSLQSVMASLIADVAQATPAVIIGLDEDTWFEFINDNILKALELFAGVKVQEKADYDAL